VSVVSDIARNSRLHPAAPSDLGGAGVSKRMSAFRATLDTTRRACAFLRACHPTRLPRPHAAPGGAARRSTLPPARTPAATNGSDSRAGSTRASRRGGRGEAGEACSRTRFCATAWQRFRSGIVGAAASAAYDSVGARGTPLHTRSRNDGPVPARCAAALFMFAFSSPDVLP
jgi:hypothetical protein